MPKLLLAYHDPMFRVIQIREYARDGSAKAGSAWQYVARQPSWILRIALAVFFAILAIPVLLLLFLAFLGALVIFTVLAIVNAVINAVRGLGYRPDGRENVRIIRRPNHHSSSAGH